MLSIPILQILPFFSFPNYLAYFSPNYLSFEEGVTENQKELQDVFLQ